MTKMKATCFVLLITLIPSMDSYSQNVFYDALKLKKYIELTGRSPQFELPKISACTNTDASCKRYDEYVDILKLYYPSLAGDTPDSFIGKLRNSSDSNYNPFLEGYLQVPSGAGASDFSPGFSGVISGAITSIGGLNVTTFADELSQFLISRAKQELNIAFFNRLKVFFDKTPEIRVLFPKTTDALENLLSYEYPTMIKTLRNVFFEDLQDVFFKMDDVFKLPKYRPLIEEFPEIILSLKTIQVVAEIDNEQHPSDIIGDFKNIPEWKEFKPNLSQGLHNFYAALQIGHTVSESVRFQKLKDFVLKSDTTNGQYIIQLDTGIAEAKNNTTIYYEIDTIQTTTVEQLTSAISKRIRKTVIDSLICKKKYRDAFLKNLFGNEFSKVSAEFTSITPATREELISDVEDKIIEKQNDFKNDISDFEVTKLIRSYDSTRAWVTRQHLNYLIQDSITFKIYLGLLYQQSKNEGIYVITQENDYTEKKTTAEDSVLVSGSLLTKGSIIKTGSKIDNKTYTADFTLIEDLVIKSLDTLEAGSEIAKSSIIRNYKYFHDVLFENKNKLFIIRDKLVEFIELAEEVDKTFNEIKQKRHDDEKVDKEELYNYINLSLDVFEFSSEISHFFQDELKFDSYLKIARNGNDMYLNVVKEEYSAAVNNLITILNLILEESKKNKDAIAQANSTIQTAIAKADAIKKNKKILTKERAQARREVKSLKKQKDFGDIVGKTTKILKYGTFMANIVQSDSAEEVRAAIEAAALPVGSYTIKRQTSFNIALNGYLGGFYGREKLSDAPDMLGKWKKSFGVSAPIGVAFSKGFKNKKDAELGALSIFLSAIDLGSIVSFRLQNPVENMMMMGTDTTMTESINVAELPTIKFKNILAPGAYLIYGVPKAPISVGFGIQRGPQLRKIFINEETEVDGETTETLEATIDSSAWRWNFSISVDIPLLNLYTKPR